MKQRLTIGHLIEFLHKNHVYAAISILPNETYSIYLSWWGENNKYLKALEGTELSDLLNDAIDLVVDFQNGDKTGWMLTNRHDEEIDDQCLILK